MATPAQRDRMAGDVQVGHALVPIEPGQHGRVGRKLVHLAEDRADRVENGTGIVAEIVDRSGRHATADEQQAGLPPAARPGASPGCSVP